jgi:LuxR family transcriptional regulator, maltose regulon positive regulatory protein
MGNLSKETFAKITRPSSTELYARRRLFRLLDESRPKPVTFISGPPGSGKTSVVTSYLKDRKLPCLWYQMDEGDADLATFFYYMGIAAKMAAPRYKNPLPLFTPEYGFGVPTFTRRYFETLCSRLKPPYVIVLDNYQEIPPESAFHEIIRTGLSAFPGDISAVLISRSEPPAAFAAMEAGNKLHTIGWNDLKLTPDESKGIARLQAIPPQLHEWLHDKADGLAAGLVLLARTVKSRDVDPEAVRSLTPEKVFDYFAGELFSRIERPLQDFLLKTAFVPKITPALAEALTGDKSAGRILANLNQGNIFTEKRAQPEVNYQYHALFREFLIARAEDRFLPEELSGLRLEAAKLLQASGEIENAAELFTQAGAWKELTALVRASAGALLRQGRNRLVEKWIAALPEELLGSDPWLNFWLGSCRLASNPAESRAILERAFRIFVSMKDEAGSLLAWSGAVQTFLYDFDDLRPLERWISWLDERTATEDSFPSSEIALSVAAGMTAALTWRIPTHPDMRKWAERALSLSKNSSNIEARTRAYSNIAVHHLWMGEFDECGMLIREMKEMILSEPVSPLRSLVLKHNEALFYNTSAKFQRDALRTVTEALEEAGKSGVYVLNSFLYTQGISASLNAGNPGAAAEFLSQMEKTLRSNSRAHTSHYLYLSACYSLYVGKISQAVTAAKKGLDLTRETGVPISEALLRLVLCQALIETGDQEETSRELAETKRAVMHTGSSYFEYLYGLTEAHFEYTGKNEAAGLESLRKAMTLGHQKGFTTFLYFWRPEVMALLCEKALEAGIDAIDVGYVKDLIRKLDLVPHEPSLEIEGWPWPLKIFTLGRFEIQRDEKPLQYPVRAPRALLALLKAIIAFGRAGVKEDQLVDALWPEADGDTAHQTFKTALHRLRQLIGEEKVIQVREGRVVIDPQYCWVDAHAFESLLENAERLLHENQDASGSPNEGVRLAEKALSLYRGSFLGEEAMESWAVVCQERLRSKFIRAVRRLGNYFERTGQWERAAESYQKGLEADELAEEFYQRLMTSYLSLGRRAEAIGVYNRCRRVLQSVLGIDPSSGTEEILKILKEKAKDYYHWVEPGPESPPPSTGED